MSEGPRHRRSDPTLRVLRNDSARSRGERCLRVLAARFIPALAIALVALPTLDAQDRPSIGELRQQGRYAEAIPLAEARLEQERERSGADHWRTTDAARILATLRTIAALPESAQQELAEADRLTYDVTPQLRQGNVAEAIATMRRQLELRGRHLDAQATGIATVRLRLGHILHVIHRDFEAAEPLLLGAAKTLSETMGNHPYVATAWSYLGWLRKDQGALRQAEPYYRKSLQVVRALDGVGERSGRNHWNNYATFQRAIGDLEGAEGTYRELLAAVGESAERANERAVILRNLAVTLHLAGRVGDAEPLLAEALKIRQMSFADGHPRLAADQFEWWEARWALRGESGGTPEDIAELDRILVALEPVFDPLWPLVAVRRAEVRATTPQALVVDAKEERAELERALTAVRTMGPARIVEVATRGARLFRQKEDATSARRWVATAVDALEQLRLDFTADPLDRARLSGHHRRLDPYAEWASLELSTGGAAPAWEILERGRGGALLDLLRLARNAPRATENADPEWQKLRRERARLGEERFSLERSIRAIDRTPEPSSQQIAEKTSLGRKLLAVREAERALERAWNARRAASLSSDDTASTLRALRKGELLVSPALRLETPRLFLRFPSDGDTPERTESWPLPPSIVEGIARIDRTDGGPLRSIDAFFTALDPAVQAALRNAASILYIPDGPLESLPAELWLPRGAKTPVTWGPSTQLLLATEPLPPRPEDAPVLVAVGDPAFGTAPSALGDPRAGTARDGLTDGWEPLPGTRREVERLGELLRDRGSQHVLLGERATESALRSVCRSPRFLHLATHGRARRGNAVLESALALTPGSEQPTDDGYLTLGELILDWDGALRGTELAVLSACESASGRGEVGEGVLALPWGFLAAGARSVLATLWPVDDLATTLLMERFYELRLGAHGPPRSSAEALAEAKEWLRTLSKKQAQARLGFTDEQWKTHAARSRGIKKKRVVRGRAATTIEPAPFADPHYWAAFLLIGEAR